MFKTKLGLFDGTTWDDIMQICLQAHYSSYQKCPSNSGGDMGIEGYTRDGKVFQCYCPDETTTHQELYERQRDKITKDLAKLVDRESDLKKHFGEKEIKEWIFITPEFYNKDLLAHCRAKEIEYRGKKIHYISDDFTILIHTIDSYLTELRTALNHTDRKILIDDGGIVEPSSIIDWAQEKNTLTDNASRKHTLRLQSLSNVPSEPEKRINKLTSGTVGHYLQSQTLLKNWEEKYPDDYEKYMDVISRIEERVELECQIPSKDNEARLKGFEEMLSIELKERFTHLDDRMIDTLTSGAVADWLLRCPLNFD